MYSGGVSRSISEPPSYLFIFIFEIKMRSINLMLGEIIHNNLEAPFF